MFSVFQRVSFVSILAVVLGLLLLLPPPAAGQSVLRRLTQSQDVLEFVWSPQADSLYITRSGRVFDLQPVRRQITGDLYRVALGDGASERLARNANSPRVPIVGDEIAFSRLRRDGTARAVVYNPRAREVSDRGQMTWGAGVGWNREGGALFFIQDSKLQRSTRLERNTVMNDQSFPINALISSTGDRTAFVDNVGFQVTQGGEKWTVAPNENGSVVQYDFVWAQDGTRLAYVVTHDGFDPELWVADTLHHTTRRIVQGQGLEYLASPAWSPDDAYLIFSRAPTGSGAANQSELWRVRADGSDLRALTHNDGAETTPRYAPDGSAIAFLRDGDVWVMPLNGDGLPQGDAGSRPAPPAHPTAAAPLAQRSAPLTIRVRHDAGNACRSVPVGQIDVIDFETYVKRVVPAEVYPTWDDDALKTQAVAARTYAWFWILQHTMSAFDVTDSTAYQYLCDLQYASTDAAVRATAGQHVDYQGYMVFAAYGAENGDPTLTNTFDNPYLLGVDDPVSFMKTRSGNGIGYSQWGAQRWATQYDWNYQQILRHYYSNVAVEAAAGSGADSTPPVGAIVAPWNHSSVRSNRVVLELNASDDLSGVAAIDLNAQYNLGGSQSVTLVTLTGSQREFVWDVSALPNQSGITVTPILHDQSGNTSTGSGITFSLDRKDPQGTMTAPATTTSQTVTLSLSATDAGGSTLQDMMFGNDWEWQGENQSVQSNSANVVADPDALNGSALRGLAGTNPAGAWYGPYTAGLPVNQAYRAYFRLKTDNIDMPGEIALLDVVTDGGANILGLKRILGTDLRTANVYQEFYVDFYYPGYTTNALEFRTAYRANASLWLDRILVVRYPVPFAGTSQWTLSNGAGTKRVIAKFADGAGNVSADAISTLFFGQNQPPGLTPRNWLPLLIKQY